MILIAAVGICVAVNLRGRSQAQHAAVQYQRLEAEIGALKRSNAALQTEIIRVTTEPQAIESAARSRLGMVRPTDVIVPLESRRGTNLATISFVR
jgi:cell division protein FtsB